MLKRDVMIKWICVLSVLIATVLFTGSQPVYAYIGPGAGFAFLGSAFIFIIVIVLAVITILLWPIRLLYNLLFGKRLSKNAKTRRVVIVGLDGFDPDLTTRYMREGLLPNLTELSAQGSFTRLRTTYPSISPVAWSSFQTGVNPGAHNIYDFLTRDKRLYVPTLSSSYVGPPKKFFKIGKYSVPLGKPQLRFLRKSQPFWKILGKAGIFCHALRVPISFPPEPFNGASLAAMCTPDLLGSQGTFSYYTTDPDTTTAPTGGRFFSVRKNGTSISAHIEGPAHPFRVDGKPLTIPFTVTVRDESSATVILQDTAIDLKKNVYTPWITLSFKAAGITISGICRLCLRETEPHLKLYVSPINIDPASPALPISHPKSYAVYLARQQGTYGTLGLLEDTWALNESALDNETFLKQTYLNHDEREQMFFDALDKTKTGVCTCVFDASDRIQHMFWRYIDPKHPAPTPQSDIYKHAITNMYRRMDDLVGKVQEQLKRDDVLIVMSDHGFKSFRRCININTWLWKNRFLALNSDTISGNDYFQDVDWSKTVAFAVGLGGIFLNRRRRERYGIVSPDDAPRVKEQIINGLTGLTDPADNAIAINTVYDGATIFKGAYAYDAPDMVVGYADGYRVSWESVTGKLTEHVFSDNTKPWSGDHGVDTAIVDGVLFCNRPIGKGAPDMYDIAPTVLSLFDVPIPNYMEGEPLL